LGRKSMQRDFASASVETLESRSYLSAQPNCSLAPSSPTAVAGAEKLMVSPSATRHTITNSKVTTPVDLTPDIQGMSRRGAHAKTITVEVLVKNAGPVAAKGPLRITVQFSYYLNGANPFPFKVVTTPINIAAGGSKMVHITRNIPKTYRPFEYDMVVTLNGNKKIPETNYANNVDNSAYYYLAP
jgi:hypothetical protein